eukprot:CAMPEP_0185255870 /NCGR_PEP_ID=MMETSP1359-20130426/4934_1 /TAXON_ID=552665 /ORGANISM="Bigelowiella longifila, Strain CCMP242" /LENGTH=399 /DNA_ID=CAMNT_0027840069 /DNA_START=146 /DNA_END=1345 /DNA_ORIENTATION=-
MSGQRRANKETGSLLPRSLSDYESSSSFACEDRSLRRDLSIESGKSPDISFVEAKKPLEKLAFYRHQVAGHYPIFWKKGEVCKSIQKNELEFYKHIQAKIPELVPFVPKYLGVVDMEYGELPPTPTDSNSRKFEFSPQANTTEFNHFNSWGLRCHQKKKQALKRRSVIKYIRLEDLTLPFSRPNILDLKIGTRVHGVNDDPEKVRRKMRKSALTTSKSLGLRLCGMQVYNSIDDGYKFHDKFFGRDLDNGGFEKCIKEFFSSQDGKLRIGVMESLIQRIEMLLKVVAEQKSFQFFSSSLLFICEGCLASDQKRLHGNVKNDNYQRVDLRFIDFAQAARDTERKGVDDGFLLGLRNIVKIMRRLINFSRDGGTGSEPQQISKISVGNLSEERNEIEEKDS